MTNISKPEVVFGGGGSGGDGVDVWFKPGLSLKLLKGTQASAEFS